MTVGEVQSSALRRFVLAVLTFGLFGVLADLLTLKHFEDSWQLVPLLLIVLGVLAIAAFFVPRSQAAL